ncbi:hypothetical protein ACFGWE_10665 [Pasteurella multocida]|uniref:hypothetical protein n=1 Tax=Pasteurella multocida TaxID=747 RepID=UPI0009F4CAFE|nr:hypothetical protein [Pasteurella multocida]MEB3502255.1 hypothetical protein [Pasteurella multocida]PNM06780.1 hypothetical protein A6J89_000160 [Pasteurella multocida]WVM64553.1 hypothetical protein V0I11_11165 [Pasteurella multocida]
MTIINRKIIYFALNRLVDVVVIALHIGKFVMYLFTAFFFMFSFINLFIGGEWISTLLQAGIFLVISVLIEVTVPLLKENLKKILAAKIIGVYK